MAMFGIRDALKSGIKRVFGDGNPPPPPTVARPPVPRPAPVVEEPASETPAAEQAAAQDSVPETTAAETAAAETAAAETGATESTGTETSGSETAAADGPVMTYDEVWELLDEMVRPALQSDGGDISLIKVEDNNVHVKLVGACSTCPSSIMTMKMGVEALLREEFPHMRDLVQVDA